MQENFTQQFADVEQRIQHLDKTHDENELVIQKDLASLASEHEMFASTTLQDFKNIEQALDNESQSLTRNFNDQLEQLKTHLESVSKELSSSKTDRKTLAKLLATMATNLEDDEL
jgi:chromosome segregation ATPase